MSDRIGYLSLAEPSSSPRSALSRASSDPLGPLTMYNGDHSSPWAARRGASSNRSSPGSDGFVAGSVMSLQSINGAAPNGSRIMDQFEMIYVNEPEPRYICPACEKVMRYPVQFEECGHRCCSACLHNIVKVAPRCPIDQIKIDPRNSFVDKAFQRDIDAMLVKCVNTGRGCQWTGTANDLKAHMEACEFAPVVCPKNCGLTFGRCFLVRHLVDDCPRRDVKCDFCGDNIVYAEEIEHMRVCSKYIISCPHECGKKDIPRDQIENHAKDQCPKATIDCPFVNAGCSQQMLRVKLDQHLDACFDEHYEMVVQALIGLQSALVDREAQLAANVERLRIRAGQLTAINAEAYIWRIENWSEVNKRAKSGRAVSVNGPTVTTGTLGVGYRLSPIVYPYGDGIDQAKFMSVFVLLLNRPSQVHVGLRLSLSD